MNNKTQLEIDFVRWLREKCRGVESKYGRWLEDEDGDANGGEYCTDCIDIQQAENAVKGDPYVEIRGWNEALEVDSQSRCDRCYCLIHCQPTDFMFSEEVDHLTELSEMGAEDAFIYHTMFVSMDSSDRDAYWHKVKPHAERLMAADGIEVVPDGFITYRPGCDDWYSSDDVWLGIYQWFADHLHAWMNRTGKGDRAWLCDTSGINRQSYQQFSKHETPKKCIDKILRSVGADNDCGAFLASIGLASHEDLLKPIRLPDQRCEWPTFDVRGRVFNYHPNDFHPDATVLTRAYLQYSAWRKQWNYIAHYGYDHHDHSSWFVDVVQADGESLPEFAARISVDMEANLVPKRADDHWRSRRLEAWDELRTSIGRIFMVGLSDNAVDIADAMTVVDGVVKEARRINLTPRRLKTLKSWIE